MKLVVIKIKLYFERMVIVQYKNRYENRSTTFAKVLSKNIKYCYYGALDISKKSSGEFLKILIKVVLLF